LGGYVKISGMIDESMDKEQMKKDPEPWEFRAKPAWQRLIIMLGGVTVNVLLAIFIYSMILFVWGDIYLKNENVVDGVTCSDFAKEIGFNDGDKIISIDGVVLKDFNSLFYSVNEDILMRDDPFVVVVNRSGNKIPIEVNSGIIGDWVKSTEG
jgi:regulator of sigma E protease